MSTLVRGARVRPVVRRSLLADALDWWQMRQHERVPVGEAEWCTGHADPTRWPCRQWTEAASRRAARRVAGI